jgi:hypothetical protein
VSSMAVYEKVALGEISSEEGAKMLMASRGSLPRKPSWMPRWAYIACVLLVAFCFAPFLSTRERTT